MDRTPIQRELRDLMGGASDGPIDLAKCVQAIINHVAVMQVQIAELTARVAALEALQGAGK